MEEQGMQHSLCSLQCAEQYFSAFNYFNIFFGDSQNNLDISCPVSVFLLIEILVLNTAQTKWMQLPFFCTVCRISSSWRSPLHSVQKTFWHQVFLSELDCGLHFLPAAYQPNGPSFLCRIHLSHLVYPVLRPLFSVSEKYIPSSIVESAVLTSQSLWVLLSQSATCPPQFQEKRPSIEMAVLYKPSLIRPRLTTYKAILPFSLI